VLARQALYHPSHTQSFLLYFSDSISLFAQASLDDSPPIYASCITEISDAYHFTQLLVEMESR
jgi:hypothetical protein